MARSRRYKKWFMLQVWRLQQIASVMTLVLLALSEATVLWGFLKYRGGPFANPYFMIPALMAMFGAAIWAVSIFWDLRLKMWRYQANVGMERNPYGREKLNAKEIVHYGLLWVPILERLGKDDKKLTESAEVMKRWIEKEWEDDPELKKDVGELFAHIGIDRMDILGLKQKKPE